MRTHYVLALAALLSLTSGARAEALTFLCSWDGQAPITLMVDTDQMTGRRSDRGRPYTVVKISDWAVWLAVDWPEHQGAAAIQMIQRPAAASDKSRGGRWIDVVLSSSGTVSPIDGGVCWEQ